MTSQEAAILIAARALVPLPHGVASAGGGLTIEAWPQAAPHTVAALCIREHGRVVFLSDFATVWVYHPGDWERHVLSPAGDVPQGIPALTAEDRPKIPENLQPGSSPLWTGNPVVPGTMPGKTPPTKQGIIDESTTTFQATLVRLNETWHGWQRQRRDGNG